MGKRVAILGAGLSGLRAAGVLVDRGYDVTVLERAPMAGGCTSSWTDHRDPEGRSLRKGQMQMNFPFYENLNYFAWSECGTRDWGDGENKRDWWSRGNVAFSPELDGFYFFDGAGQRSHLSATPQSLTGRLLSKLPAPASLAQILWDFDGLPRFRDKLSAVRFHLLAMLFGQRESPPLNDDWNFYGLMRHLGLTHEAVRAYRRITYSITNLSDADQVGPKFLRLFYLSYLREKGALGCRMMNDDCNPALIDRLVASLSSRGVEFRFNCPMRDILVRDGRCVGVEVEDLNGCPTADCPNCGLRFPATAGRNCPVCSARLPPGLEHAEHGDNETLEPDFVVSALQPHQLARLYRDRDDHPLRAYPEFRALGQFKGAVLTVSRVYLDRRVGSDYNLTGLDRDEWTMNGAMDISTVMPRFQTSAYDVLCDDGEVLSYYPSADLRRKVEGELVRIFPEMAAGRVTGHLLARIGPDALYHRPHPRLNSRFLPHANVTPLANLFLGGDWTDDFELGMEAAIKGGLRAANALLEADGRGGEVEPLLTPRTAPLVRWLQTNPVARLIARRYERRYAAETPPRRG